MLVLFKMLTYYLKTFKINWCCNVLIVIHTFTFVLSVLSHLFGLCSKCLTYFVFSINKIGAVFMHVLVIIIHLFTCLYCDWLTYYTCSPLYCHSVEFSVCIVFHMSNLLLFPLINWVFSCVVLVIIIHLFTFVLWAINLLLLYITDDDTLVLCSMWLDVPLHWSAIH